LFTFLGYKIKNKKKQKRQTMRFRKE